MLDALSIYETLVSMEITPACLPNPRAIRPRSFSGWALKPAFDLDAACPNFLARVAYASNVKRQAIYAAIAAMMAGGGDALGEVLAAATGIVSPGSFAQIARPLTTLKARGIVRAVFGDVPDGLLGTLARLGPDPVERPTLYRDLFEVFAEPRHRARAKMLRQTFRMVNESKVEVALRLDPIFLHQPVYDSIKLHEVDSLHAALNLIRATVSDATDENLRHSVTQITPETSIKGWVLSWLRRQDRMLADPPILNDPELVRIGTTDLAVTGRRMRNCLADKVLRAVVGRNAYYQWLPEPGAAVELTRLSDGRWMVTEVRCTHNISPDPKTAAAICRKLHAYGVVTIDWPFPTSTTRAIASLLDAWDLTSDWSGIEGIPDAEDDTEQSLLQAA